jgi:NAD(P)-dependent dehydrogenase (short-subunit alcohol dehydrogenase family)
VSRPFDGKVALVTGGNRGIGLAVAQLLLEGGAQVMLAARDSQKGLTAAADLGAQFVALDVRRADLCRNAVDATLAACGRLDILVNGAGIIYRNRTVDVTSEEDWDTVMAVNVKGVFLMSKYALPALRQTRGTIVNIASYTGLVGFAGSAAYAASKAAVVNLTRTMALDHAKDGIRVNCVCPGSVDTDMIHAAWQQTGNVESARLAWAAKHPLGRIAEPREVAQAVAFLASSDSSFITGAALPDRKSVV